MLIFSGFFWLVHWLPLKLTHSKISLGAYMGFASGTTLPWALAILSLGIILVPPRAEPGGGGLQTLIAMGFGIVCGAVFLGALLVGFFVLGEGGAFWSRFLKMAAISTLFAALAAFLAGRYWLSLK